MAEIRCSVNMLRLTDTRLRRRLARMTWTRRQFVTAAGAAAVVGRRVPAFAAVKPITVSHSVSTFVYGQHLVAKEKKFFEEEGVAVPSFIVPGGGAKVAQVLAAGKELFDRGVKSVEALGDAKLVGRQAVVAATAIGSGTYVYGVYVLKGLKAPDGKAVNEHVEWVSGGGSTTMLGGLKAGKFDAIMAVPEWQWAAEEEGFGTPIYDVQDEKAWTRVFGGPIPVTVGYALRETIEKSPDTVQGYVNACYRAQQWIHRTKDEDIVELLHRPYMDTYSRDNVLRSVKYYKTIFDWDFTLDEKAYANGTKVWVPLAVDKPVPYAKAVDTTFVKKARAKFKS